MKVVLLTTDTIHHRFFASQVNRFFPISSVLLERRPLRAPFETFHPFEDKRDTYERNILLRTGLALSFKDWPHVVFVPTINHFESLNLLKIIKPDVLLVFGTGKLNRSVIQIPNTIFLNLHGGNPEAYRGLDSHLWAIYHKEFRELITTLHVVDENLDTGDIVGQAPIVLTSGSKIYQLRLLNTQVCVELTLSALRTLANKNGLSKRKQRSKGRYYSFMPSVLKELCVRNFEQIEYHDERLHAIS
jgi:methionyl-tRNA formyltransferase